MTGCLRDTSYQEVEQNEVPGKVALNGVCCVSFLSVSFHSGHKMLLGIVRKQVNSDTARMSGNGKGG